MREELHNRHRPQDWDEIAGQEVVVESVAKALEEGTSRSFLFAGPSGVGKTTISRVIASKVEAEVSEVDAATHTGVDAMRAIQDTLHFSPLNAENRVVIVDECHMLSKAAWNSLLKVIEEPPTKVYWCLCTTEIERVPETIKTRCLVYRLDPVPDETILDLLHYINEEEKFEADEDVMWLCAEKANGSPRRAITMFAAVKDCETRQEAAILLRQPLEDGEAIELCQALIKGFKWSQVVDIVRKLRGLDEKGKPIEGRKAQDPEGVRRIVCAYFAKVAMNPSWGKAEKALAILAAFERPYPTDQPHHLLLSLGELYVQD